MPVASLALCFVFFRAQSEVPFLFRSSPRPIELVSTLSALPRATMGKPRGIRTARKHVKNRRAQVWADLDYKKAHLGTRWKANPFGGASHAKGIVLEKVRETCLASSLPTWDLM